MEKGGTVKQAYVTSGGCFGQGGMKEMVVCTKFGRLGEAHGHPEVVEPYI